jgi:protein-S-isoprenylcysteine O-methyltransferase Ste14
MKNLNATAWLALAVLDVVMGLVLFVPAGTFLARNLPGYTEYQKRVRHRLVPFVW